MYRRKRTTTLVVIFLMLLSAMVYLLWNAEPSKADGPPDDPSISDPCFRQDPECYEQREVECDNNVFVPMNPDGTWTCPPLETPWVIPPGTRPGPDQVSPGGSHPFFSWVFLFELLLNLFH